MNDANQRCKLMSIRCREHSLRPNCFTPNHSYSVFLKNHLTNLESLFQISTELSCPWNDHQELQRPGNEAQQHRHWFKNNANWEKG